MTRAGERLIKAALEARDTEFKPCTMMNDMGDTEVILEDCLMVWERWGESAEIALDESGKLVGVRLIGFCSPE